MKLIGIILLVSVLYSCGGDEITVPKPPTYLRMNLPEHEYYLYSDDCQYSFEISKLF